MVSHECALDGGGMVCHAFEVVDHLRALCCSDPHADADEMPLHALLAELLGEEARGDFGSGGHDCMAPKKGVRKKPAAREKGWG